MTPRSSGRTEPCSPQQARTRLAQAEMFADVADLVLGEHVDTAPGVAAALSVLAGIAAADAACGAVLGRRSRGQDHRQAADRWPASFPTALGWPGRSGSSST